MRIEDLMIGDWVLQDELNVPVKIRSIMRHHVDNVCFYHKASEYISGVYKLQPIPLTQEMLEKNGYKFNGLWYERDGYPSIEVGLYNGEYNIGKENLSSKNDPDFDTFVTIKYVHELQHVFKLFNDNDDINLNKEYVV